MARPIRVLVVDDSALVRELLKQGLSQDPGIAVVGTASDPYMARDKIVELAPDVLTLDVEMPRMDGVAFLRRLMPQYPLPVVMVSSLTEQGKQITLDALEAGAVDFVTKPGAGLEGGLNRLLTELRTKVRIASTANVSHWKQRRTAGPPTTESLPEGAQNRVIAIGASTGGTEAIREILCRFPPWMPGVLVVQHMPPGFTRMFAERMNSLCLMTVKEAKDGDAVVPGRVLVAPGDLQMRVHAREPVGKAAREPFPRLWVSCRPDPLVCGHRPSVEALMQSVARHVGPRAVALILTGMGSDGATGMAAVQKAGGTTLGQDAASCVVYGMPRAAEEKGGVQRSLPLDQMARAVLSILRGARD